MIKFLLHEFLCCFDIIRITVFPLRNKKNMVCHHATFFIIKLELSENMAKFTHTPEALRRKKISHHYTVSKY